MLLLLLAAQAEASWIVGREIRDGTEISAQAWEAPASDPGSGADCAVAGDGPTLLRRIPSLLLEGGDGTGADPVATYEEIRYCNLPKKYADKRVPALKAEGTEVRTLVDQGPTANRIDLTIVGDGYTTGEKDRFFEDAARITRELFEGQTFASYLPLFNVHAVFVPSQESGISDGKKKNTALGLYRDPPGSKRAIMPGDSFAIRQAVALAPDSDYPILVANDDYYGGLGGRYAITTRSLRSGTMVLRHELGHNFGDVGEEYDGGQVYSGANHSSSKDVPWAHWLTDESGVHEARYLSGAYLWKNLASGPIRAKFQFPAGEMTPDVLVSAVGFATSGDVEASLDGQAIGLAGEFTEDRSFFRLGFDRSLAPGSHVIEFREKIADGDNVLAFAEIYALPVGYDATPGRTGAFATYYGPGDQAGFRPTHEDCLMRNMLSVSFCPVDQENMWTRFLDRARLIDSVKVTASRQVALETPSLPGLKTRWYAITPSGEKEVDGSADSLLLDGSGLADGKYRVRVSFRTAEVRQYTKRFDDQADFELK